MPENVQLIPIKSIVNKFDVRVALDEDRVIQFAGLYDGGVEQEKSAQSEG